MPNLREEHYSDFSVEQLYGLIVDIEQYPAFIPWCKKAQIISVGDNNIVADLSVNFQVFTEEYRSNVSLTPPSDGYAKVEVNMISGPFKHLTNIWELKREESVTKVIFYVDFEFKSSLLSTLANAVLTSVYTKMLEAFEKRAEELYSR